MSGNPIWIGPSIMTADLLRLGAQIADAEAAGVDYLHLDVMDGRFVPNISFGLPMAEAMRRASGLPLDVHLMIVEPDRYAAGFVSAGADSVTVHAEACIHLDSTLRALAEGGAVPGVTINPGTPLGAIEEVLPIVGQVLLMSVNPGFGGQTFIPATLDRIRRLRRLIDERNPGCRLQVDGGIKASNIREVVEAGADTIVVGSAIYSPGTRVADAVKSLRAAIADVE
ncbi:MAG: ribulose-phosphate 3-epimerase [Thermomicrobiales bacterium]